jgi:phosphatidylglycerol---prolipoprotein diacylglyceryl transferase
MFAAIPHPNIDPVALQIGPFEVYWYALAYVAGILFCVWYIKQLAQTPRLWGANRPTVTPEEADQLFLYVLLGIVAGGRLGYVLFYDPAHYFANPMDILRIRDGGMSFHGGFLGVVVACLLFGRPRGKTLDRMLDLGAAGCTLGLGLGRVANFINAELYGRASDVPWAVIFPGDTVGRHPSQLYEAVLEGLILFVAVRIATHRYGALKHPGRASGIFALGYGLSRIFVEFFREPDAQIGYIAGFMTMGMVLSLPLVAIGIWLLLRSRRTG